MTIDTERRDAPAPPAQARTSTPATVSRRLYLPTVLVAGLAAWLGWCGWTALAGYEPARSILAGQFELAGPAVLGFVIAVFLIERVRPAERRPLLARGHLLDMGHLLVYALVVVPITVLIGAGFSSTPGRVAPWLVLPRIAAVPSWCFIAMAVLAIGGLDWPAHRGNHRVTESAR
jgi:hypothetical protein